MQNNKHLKIIKIIEIAVISALVCVLSAIFGDLQYEANDDVVINLISAGAFGELSQYNVHNGILFGYFLKVLYSLFPNVNCYLISYLVFNVVSMVALGAVFSDAFLRLFVSDEGEKSAWKSLVWTGIIAVTLNLLLAKDFYIYLQYTKNGEIYACVGIMLLISVLGRKDTYLGRMILGSAFLALALSVREESVIQVLPLAVLAFISVAFIKRKGLSFSLKGLMKWAIPVVASFLIIGTNFAAFNLNKEWSDYYKWDAIMVQKRDYGNYNFDWDKDEYLANGFTEWDFRLMEEWMWNDCDNFTLEKMQLMAEIGKDHKMNSLRFDPELMPQAFAIIKDSFSESPLPIFAVVVFVMSFALCLIKRNWGGLLGCALVALGSLFEFYYLACLRRYPWRVAFGIWLAGAIFMLATAMFTTSKIKINVKLSQVACVVLTLCVLFGAWSWQNTNLDYSHRSWDNKDTERYEKMQSIRNTDGLFVMSISEMFGGMCGASNIWDINKMDYEGFYENIIPVGGWTIPSPIGMYYAHINGISNVFKAFSEREDIYYVGGGESMGYLLVYQNEKYGPGISVSDVEFDWGTA